MLTLGGVMRVLIIFGQLLTTVLMSVQESRVKTIRIELPEDADAGSLVGRTTDLLQNSKIFLSEFQLFSQTFSSPTLDSVAKRLRYSSHEWFDLDKNSGEVTLRHQVDREEVCRDIKECMIRLQIFIVALQQLINLEVIIKDVNDNAPLFMQEQIIMYMSESAAVGEMINLNQFQAKDFDIVLIMGTVLWPKHVARIWQQESLDTLKALLLGPRNQGNNGKILYSITPSKFFKLEQFQENEITTRLQLVLTNKLDYEESQVEKLTLTAMDEGIPQLRSNAQLVIQILDANDNEPKFEREEYTITLLENYPLGTVFIRLLAHDEDSEFFGRLRYSVSDLNKPFERHVCDVDKESGEVILKRRLDREAYEKVDIIIEARDSSPTNPKVGSTWLSIKIEDVNDNTPLINMRFLISFKNNTAYLPENHSLEKHIAHITAVDEDLGKNGEVSMKLVPTIQERNNFRFLREFQNVFHLRQDGFLGINRSLDRELQDNFKITIQACDKGFPLLCSTRSVRIIVLDVNDHRPTFIGLNWAFSLSEDAAIGTILTTIHAKDNDNRNTPALFKNKEGKISTSPYGKVRYLIEKGDDTFSIHSSSGKITLSKTLDRERKGRYQITVRAKDGGNQMSLESKQELTVEILDVNDNRPIFIQPATDNVTVYASKLLNQAVTTVKATDRDEGRNGLVRYRIISVDGESPRNSSAFDINVVSGILKFNSSNQNLNSTAGPHQILIQAFDCGTPSLKSHLAIQVVLIDSKASSSVTKFHFKMFSIVIVGVTFSSAIFLVIMLALVFRKKQNEKKQGKLKSQMEIITSNEKEDSTLATVGTSYPDKPLFAKTNDGSNASCGAEDFHHALEPSSERRIANTDDSPSLQVKLSLEETKRFSHPAYLQVSLEEDTKRMSPIEVKEFLIGNYERTQGDNNQLLSSELSQLAEESYFLEGSTCSEQCLQFGHSDACWMQISQGHGNAEAQLSQCSSGVFRDKVSGVAPRLHPGYWKDQIHTPQSARLRYFSPFPANELTSIYSSLLVKAHFPNSSHCSVSTSQEQNRNEYVTQCVSSDAKPSEMSEDFL